MQLVVLMPLMFAAMFVGVQAAVWHHARTIAFAAAQEGVTAAAGEGGSISDGIAVASSFAHAKGGDVLTGASVSGRRSGAVATVTVRGAALSVIPGLRFGVEQSATAPLEQLTR